MGFEPVSRIGAPRNNARVPVRRVLVQIHLWLGLVVGFVWALQGLTGAALVFHREIDRLSLPHAAVGPMAPIDGLIAAAQRHAAAPIERIGIADARGDLLTAAYTDAAGHGRALLLDAATGAVTGTREDHPGSPFTGSATRWLYTVHETLLLGERGETLVGVSGILLLTGTITGLWLGWPRRKAWRAAFAYPRWRSAAQALFGWHRMVGLVVGFALLVTVPGGVWMIFQGDLRPALAKIVPYRLPYKPAPGPVSARTSAAAALATARGVFPDAGFVRLTLPTPDAPVYTVRLRQPGEARAWSGVTSVTLDPATGRVLDAYDPLTAPRANRLADAAFSAHNGELLRLPGRILIFLSGLALPTLWVTGLLAWARKRRAQARNHVARAPAAALPA